MLKSKFKDNQTSCSGEEDFKRFYHLRAWRPSWSCDQDSSYKFIPHFEMRLHIKFGFDWLNGFRDV